MQTTPGGIRVDWQGNIYVGMPVRPVGHKPPVGFEKNGGYNNGVGSVVKFSPEGGSITGLKGSRSAPPKVPHGKKGMIGYQGKRSTGFKLLENAVSIYPELGCHSGSYGDGCMCRQPMFDIDGWGRLYIPNAITYSARIVDNAGNLIQKFGKYGNIDSRGPGKDSLIKTPAVPLGWPEAAGASYKAVYVSDVLNRRIVRMKKVYAAEEACGID